MIADERAFHHGDVARDTGVQGDLFHREIDTPRQGDDVIKRVTWFQGEGEGWQSENATQGIMKTYFGAYKN